MDASFEQKVRERAYEIWMAAGMTDGMALDHWCAAERDMTPAAKPKAVRAKATASKAPPKKTAAKKAAAKSAPKRPALSAKKSSSVSATLN